MSMVAIEEFVFELVSFLAFTAVFFFCAWMWVNLKRKRVKCQCGYEYEGRTLPRRCPQCGKPLYIDES
ncbi:hypothetical protein GTO27_12690 [Candidatus Bathyarchaeota archaeon]|nr:hypothetical protein [Candidatus Bathyarchaeota archaeon]